MILWRDVFSRRKKSRREHGGKHGRSRRTSGELGRRLIYFFGGAGRVSKGMVMSIYMKPYRYPNMPSESVLMCFFWHILGIQIPNLSRWHWMSRVRLSKYVFRITIIIHNTISISSHFMSFHIILWHELHTMAGCINISSHQSFGGGLGPLDSYEFS